MLVSAVTRRAKSIRHRLAGRIVSPYSRLYLVADEADWVLRQEMREVAGIASGLGIRQHLIEGIGCVPNQVTFHSSQYVLLRDDLAHLAKHRFGLAYFHGMPNTPGEDALNQCYRQLCCHHQAIDRVQASHTVMRDAILESGISPEKVHLIRIAIDTDTFPLQTRESKREAREALGLPGSAVVIGSFQKDGNGWGEGLEPKLIKGPDVFCDTLAILKERIPGLYVLLTGPARGYVKQRLASIGLPYTHRYLDRYADVSRYFQALDGYLVASRQEGGPKAIFEAMSSGVPIVSTRVGQAVDVIEHGVNGWLADVGEPEGLAHWMEEAVSRRHEGVLKAGRLTAEHNTYRSQVPLWQRFFDGFVEAKR